ncbi:MarR family winged helix-turn-helix transcriptional regulator [Actinospica sp.]|jgi:DNA-binding MarR family transcriptional regulator|uniref:MarR family winged helix-turn-helix transcriptional regulator n=1 Tax=Actinospica sp. TaxID=1872142 RepID=UPI002B59B95D|nr:MarR family transcriptional regulator [Actinospica sp.]HWG22558.1 MarR family transcriptional regulator [Actinospica sp.]
MSTSIDTSVDIGREQELRLIWDRIRTMVYDDDRRAEVSAAAGLSFVKVKALRRLLKQPMPMRDLAALLVVDKPYMTQVVDALEERGLVLRTVDVRDRRCRIVSLTEEGREVALRSEEILTRPPAVLALLPDADLAELTRILASLPTTGDGEPS